MKDYRTIIRTVLGFANSVHYYSNGYAGHFGKYSYHTKEKRTRMSKALGDKERAQLIAKLREIENPSSAIQFLSTTICKFPGDSDLYYKRGIKYSSIGEAGKAIADFEKALELNPSHADAMMTRATVLLLQENYQEAKSGFDEFITAVETDEKLHWNKIKRKIFKISALSYRGISKTHIGDFLGAINDLDAAIALKPPQDILQKINTVKTNVPSNLGKEHLEASVENVNFLPSADEMIKGFFIKGISVFVALLCIVVSIKSCVADSNSGTVYTQEATEETEGLSKPSQSSVSTEASPKVVEYEGSSAQRENIERYGQDRYKALEACVDEKIAKNASIEETASDCNPSNF